MNHQEWKMPSKKISVLIISQYFPPDISGAGTRAFNYTQCLVQQNYDVTVITAHPHLHSDVPKEYRNKLMHKEKMHGFNLIRVWIPSLLHSSAKNRIILHFSFILSSLFPIFSIKPDIIFIFEPNLFSIIPGYIYSKVRRVKVIRAVDDLWPEAFYDRGYAKSKLFKKLLHNFAKFSYVYPKYNLPVTEEVKDVMHKSYGISYDKIEIILHGIDTNIFTFKEKKREQYFVLMYSGSLVESYDFDIIINAAKTLKHKNIKFVIRGNGIMLSHIQEQKKKFALDNLVIDTKIVPLDNISEVLSDSDVLLAPMIKEYALNSTLPTKILEYQAIGRPIICCSNGAPGNYVEKTKSGIRVDHGNLDAFIDAILKLESDPLLCDTLGKNGRTFVEENLTFDKIGKHLSEIIQRVLDF